MNAAIDEMLDEVPEAESSAWDPDSTEPAPSRQAHPTLVGIGEPLVVRGVAIAVTRSADLPYHQARSRRQREVGKKTERTRDLRRHLRLVGRDDLPRMLPATRGDCKDGVRPCPYVSCRYHLYADVERSGGLRLAFPDLEPDEIPYTCAIDVAEAGGATLEQVAVLTNVTRERVRQIEAKALQRLKPHAKREGLEPGIDPEEREDLW